jgi:hypothetical protein
VLLFSAALALVAPACGHDGGDGDAGVADAGVVDGGAADGGARDAGDGGRDGGALDAAGGDAGGGDAGGGDAGGGDAGGGDAGDVDAFAPPIDAGTDAFAPPIDAGHDAFAPPIDAGTDAYVPPRDAGPASGCVSGAPGALAVRFAWRGSGAGSTAYPSYEVNQLPDTSRWHVAAYSRSIGYTPVFDDVFLGPGGLDLEGTAFIDVQLSTLGLTTVRSATLAIYGRSFDTTASGSFSWQTFHGTGAAPTDLVANSTPYEWYLADATTELVANDSGVLLRIYPGPSSGALIVNRVEICFDAD